MGIQNLSQGNDDLESNFQEAGQGRSQDGGGIGRGDHFLFYKFIKRTTER